MAPGFTRVLIILLQTVAKHREQLMTCVHRSQSIECFLSFQTITGFHQTERDPHKDLGCGFGIQIEPFKLL